MPGNFSQRVERARMGLALMAGRARAKLKALPDRAAVAALDVLWDLTTPIAGTCPVCAFWRGVGIGGAIVLACALVAALVTLPA